jgi:hypothetical protein
MRLGTVADLAQAIGFDPGVRTPELQGAVEAATQNVIASLGTELDRAAVVDQFYILPSGSLPVGNEYRTRLALSRGFVDGPVVLTYGPLLTDISLGIDNTSVVVNAEKGEIVITGPDLRGQYMEASYTAGFEPDANDSDVYGGVPEWLTEIATLAAMMALDANTPDVRFEKGDQGLSSARNLQRQIQTRISTKARFFPSATHPL